MLTRFSRALGFFFILASGLAACSSGGSASADEVAATAIPATPVPATATVMPEPTATPMPATPMPATPVPAAPVTSPAADPATVATALAENAVYIEGGAVVGDRGVLSSAVEKASENGLNLYVVALADDTSGLKAEAIQEAIGSSTVLLFTPTMFDFTSTEVCAERFDEARANADGAITSSSTDEATRAFVEALVAIPESTCALEASPAQGALAAGADYEAVTCLADTFGADFVEYSAAFDDQALAELPLSAQVEVVARAYPCVPEGAAASLLAAVGSGTADYPPETNACAATEIFDGGEVNRLVVEGLLEMKQDRPAPAATQEPVIQLLLTCITGDVLADDAEFEDLGAFVDKDCLSTVFNEQNMRPVWTALVQDPLGDPPITALSVQMSPCVDVAGILVATYSVEGYEPDEAAFDCFEAHFADVDLAAMLGSPEGQEVVNAAVFDCLDLARLMVAQFAADGIELSEDTVACIEATFASMDASDLADGPEGDSPGLTQMFQCLTPAELRDVMGA